jgi:dihydropyrimidinase/allantoinase
MFEMIFKNARIPRGQGNDTQVVDLVVKNGKFVAIETDFPTGKHASVIDLTGYLVLPGGVDPHVHFNTPGYEERESFENGSAFAASGGITTVIDMPCTSVPPVVNWENFQEKLRTLAKHSYVDFGLWGGVSGNLLEASPDWPQEMQRLWDVGVVGFKTYALSDMASFTHLSEEQLSRVATRVAEMGALLGHHAEDAQMVLALQAKLQAIGCKDPKAYGQSRPAETELLAVRRMAEIAWNTGARVHIVHVSAGVSVDEIQKYKRKGINISGETCPHYLEFILADLIERGSLLKTAPVLKTAEDRRRLWEGLQNRTLDFVASDHAPCPWEMKTTGSIWTDYGGISGTGTLLPYLYSEGYRQRHLTLARLVELTATNAAKRFDLYPRKGTIAVGADADFICIDEDKNWIVKGAKFYSKGKFSPFEGYRWLGQIHATYLRGRQIYQSGQGMLPGYFGEFVPRFSVNVSHDARH